MTNTSDVTLYQWTTKIEPETLFDIDWPAVHDICGVDHIEWINKQDPKDCEMLLEFFNNGTRLVVTFYNPEVEATYHLMWAK